ncbi:uncharacterized protein [Aristolochia californica]|uniref:uncharacterized protein n=1 Tax=Aristolochia californica TaxID=171875 RepID=UPI0035E1C3CD
MKLGITSNTNQSRFLQSWKDTSDPSAGKFSLGLSPIKPPQVYLWRNSEPYWRNGPWNGRVFLGVPGMGSVYLDGFSITIEGGSVDLIFGVFIDSELNQTRFMLNSTGNLLEQEWDDKKKEWFTSWTAPANECDVYDKCGPYGVRNPLSSPLSNGSSTAEKEENNFLKMRKMKPPDSIASLSFHDAKGCEGKCLCNCSCVAYAFDAGIGCMFWSAELIDLQIFRVDGVDLYVRLPASELALIANLVVGTELSDQAMTTNSGPIGLKHQGGRELPIFDFKVVAFVTDNFSPANKLGEGGFGPVYRGTLPGGQEVAVKRLSRSSGQGLQEFRNEVLVISRVQHKNLVRLVGYCIQGEEKMLLYEYLPNKSLDAFIFDSDEQKLDWRQRFHIIEGIARGLLYLHRDSRLKIIHRDLKASNILLDKELNPKISDFGLARIFGGDQIQANTSRVVGTYGYMSPEYAMEGRFSEKADVFSFGVLLLEIAWQLWNDGQALEFIDPKLRPTCSEVEVLRCIHVGLLCTQEFAADRPTMSDITVFLGTDTGIPLTPKRPAFTLTTSRESTTHEERCSVPIQTVVWVANRGTPISDSSGILTIADDGNLVILDSKKTTLWSTNTSELSSNSTALLSDSGNLILRDDSSGNDLWESFDHPTDSFLPGMKLGLDGQTGLQKVFTSWKSPNDPAEGDFYKSADSDGAPQVVLWKGSRRHWRSGVWNGETFAGVANKRPIYLFGFRLSYDNQNGNDYFSFTLFNNSDFVRYRTRWDGVEEQFAWDERKEEWVLSWSQPTNVCEDYGRCGEYAICSSSSSAVCTCLKGFKPKSAEEWSKGNWKGGCSRRTPLACKGNSSDPGERETDGFYSVEGIKLPDYEDWVAVANEEECKQSCYSNCTCRAYTYANGIGCLLWGRNLLDIRHFPEGGSQLNVRLAASELAGKNRMPKIIVVTIALAALVVISASCILWRHRRKLKDSWRIGTEREISIDIPEELDLGDSKRKVTQLPLFDYSCVALATDNFSDENKLGQGGFGPVYKGCLEGGQEVAVKRLSSGSGQGIMEFRSEVILFANLQHRNLVRLLGCCIQGEEKMLLYELMPNKGLDAFLSDPRRQVQLDWTKRFNIIKGVSRGLLYLHRDSRLRIIHRDLKAGNVLLDEEMNPKISDFGLARIFDGDQHQARTNRVVGTYGYMSPEYAMEGIFSTKSDVYSFGVLLFEIVTGKKNSGFYNQDQSLHLLGHVWRLWSEDKATELVDPSIRDSCVRHEVLRCIHLGLLSVQDLPCDRPDMSFIDLMLESETSIGQMPKQPKFATARTLREINPEQSPECFSANEVTLTLPMAACGDIQLQVMGLSVLASSFLISFCFVFPTLHAADTITQRQSIRDGQVLISAGENFVLGFFSPGNSTRRYVGIWYYKIPVQTVVWVANREAPLSDSSGVLTFGDDGNLVISDSKKTTLWSTNTSEFSSNSTALLSDFGNLILQDNNSGKTLWQSFDHPTDTFLPGMKLGLDIQTRTQKIYTAWKSLNDPATGNFSLSADTDSVAQIVVWNGIIRYWRSAPWNGETFTGLADKKPMYLFGFRLSYDDQNGNKFFSFTLFNNSDLIRFRTRWDGMLEQLKWDQIRKEWAVTWSEPSEACEAFGKCGEYGSCNVGDSPLCSCLKGFEPKSMDEWTAGNWSSGCSRRIPLKCDSNAIDTEKTQTGGFFRLEGVKLPDHEDWVAVEDEEECRQSCLNNCTCGAYTFASGIGCLLWGRNLVDIRRFPEGGNQLYVRVTASELVEKNKMPKIIIVAIVLAALVVISLPCMFWRCRRKLKYLWKVGKEKKHSPHFPHELKLGDGDRKEKVPQLPLFDFSTVALATGNFCGANKLGQGGFGPVYKGYLSGGKEIAVKRLSSGSGQGVEEFKNEVILFAKLQHRNLVKLLGCCVQGEEKMLLYEFMPNKSLDVFILDPSKRVGLDWTKRFNIIKGISRGLLYLHRDSRLRIIHRDLKAGNILLDEEMNPKIADFGLARIFGGNQNHATTNRVVGTYGYMSPEYAMEGLFSTKSDVYSFGVLLFEIVTGKKNSGFYDEDQSLHLLRHAWKLWSEDKAAGLVDSSIRDSCLRHEVLRCVHLGLLCVQDMPNERPDMSFVAMMLESETSIVQTPKQPKFTVARTVREITPERSPESFSANDVTFTMPVGR